MKSESSGEKLLLKLKRDWQLLKKSLESLSASAKKCEAIGIKTNYTFEQSESFDALTSKFARTADILTQKIIKTSILVLREEADTFVDRMNLAEKLGMIRSAESLLQVRDLRNSISHEYESEDLNKIYAGALRFVPTLIKEIDSTERFFAKREWI